MIWWNDDFYVQQHYSWLSIWTYCRWNEVGATEVKPTQDCIFEGILWFEFDSFLPWCDVFLSTICEYVLHRTSSIHFRRCWICLSLLGSWVTVGFLSVMEYQYEIATKFPPFLSIVLDDMEKHRVWQSHRKEKHDSGFNIRAFLWGV